MRIECTSCSDHAANPKSGAYNFRCPACCARLIKSARPVRRLQEGHIAALQRFHGRDWSQVWPEIQRMLKEA
jgi:predicted RNA-binding Zn-ribbon protein involved in translation (DUF1610 family)